MKRKNEIRVFFVSVLAIALLAFAQKAQAADTSDVVLGIIGGIALGMSVDKDDETISLDLTKYEVTYIAPNGTLVLTPISGKRGKKIKEPPCARAGTTHIPGINPSSVGKVIRYPVCPNWTMPYGGLYSKLD